VLAATAAGFAILQEAFDSGERDVGVSPSPSLLPTNGEIVFVRKGSDGRSHVFAAQPDGSGVRQITNGATDDSDPAVSPDGQTIAYVSDSEDDGFAIATVPIEGGDSTKLADGMLVDDPAWSPDGTEVAFVKSGIDSILLLIVDRNGRVSRSPLEAATSLASPSWAPDGTRIALAVVPEGSQGSVGIIPTNTKMMERPLEETLGVGSAPAWSPDGSKIAFMRSGNEGDAIWTAAPDGTEEMLVATAVEASLEPDLAWAPDGTSLLVSDGDWIYRVDATPDGDPGANFVQLVEGTSPSWQPLPVGSDPPPSGTLEPSISPEPEQAGHEIGLGVRMCDLEVLDGIDWDGTGVDGAAWTGAPVDEDGRCSSSAGVQHIVAVDRDGDGVAEQGSTSTLRSCLLCQPFDTVDLNDDGVLELVVLEEASSTPTYSVYEVNRPGSERSPGVYPIIVVAPGAPAMNLDRNDAVRFAVGGDEGFSGSIECEDVGAGAPILRYTWVRGAVDTDTDLRVDITRLSFGEDGVLHIESVDRFSVPRNPEPVDLKSTEPACGVDFHPAA
jgi:Tol biopolymer transport system component